MFDIETTVAGIPCIAEMTFYEPGWAGTRWEPPEPSVAHFRILDRRGRPAPWLERKLTDDDERRIERELIEAYEEQDECEPY